MHDRHHALSLSVAPFCIVTFNLAVLYGCTRKESYAWRLALAQAIWTFIHASYIEVLHHGPPPC